MTPFQFEQAHQALQAILPLTYPADVSLSHYFRNHPALGAQDRNFIAESVFGVLRHRLWLEWRAPDATPRQLLLAYMRLVRSLPQRELAPMLSEADTAWLTALLAAAPAEQPLIARAELPDWVLPHLKDMSEADIVALGRGLREPAPLDLRVNTLKSTREQALAALQQAGWQAEPTPYSPLGIRMPGKPAINRHPLFLEGGVEVQDEGSQLLGLLLAPKRHDMVVDFCAGAGGKTLLLGALMASQGRVYAFDVSEKRINNLKPRLKRSGLSNVHPQLIAHENDSRIKRLQGKIDKVLVDAPCSGLGTLRRNPDLKWRQSEASLQDLLQRQASILESAARLVKPGGRLVYATCSILPDENQLQIARFLQSHPAFRVVPVSGLLSQVPQQGDYLQLYPHVHATDGFFAAVLERVPG
ncbi:RsmB/NOP family class I SAM-dependent RNA methyltransferase [Leeia sp.]|uniref:RsmB/NOP family class I SAM-dependent RNA methyltransferase n=1 Tax=Leeia sp. TaxID=2884678 RepID=UPI0035ADF5AF